MPTVKERVVNVRDLSLFGKITKVLGVLFFLIGVFLVIKNFDGIPAFSWQNQSVVFLCVGLSLFLSSYSLRKEQGTTE